MVRSRLCLSTNYWASDHVGKLCELSSFVSSLKLEGTMNTPQDGVNTQGSKSYTAKVIMVPSYHVDTLLKFAPKVTHDISLLPPYHFCAIPRAVLSFLGQTQTQQTLPPITELRPCKQLKGSPTS